MRQQSGLPAQCPSDESLRLPFLLLITQAGHHSRYNDRATQRRGQNDPTAEYLLSLAGNTQQSEDERQEERIREILAVKRLHRRSMRYAVEPSVIAFSRVTAWLFLPLPTSCFKLGE